METSKQRGRPRELDSPRQVIFWAEPETIEVAKRLGHGNISKGLRIAVSIADSIADDGVDRSSPRIAHHATTQEHRRT